MHLPPYPSLIATHPPTRRRLYEFVRGAVFGAAIVSIVAGIIYLLSEEQASVAAAFIAINNVALPKLMQLLMHKPGGGEHHHTHSTHEVIRSALFFAVVLVYSCFS